MPVVFIPPMMRGLTGGLERVTVPGGNLREVLDSLEAAYPGMRQRLCEGGAIKPEIAVSIDGEIADLGMIEPVGECSEVHFLPAIAGGG